MALSKCQMLTCKVAEGVISAVNCYKNNNKITREKKQLVECLTIYWMLKMNESDMWLHY